MGFFIKDIYFCFGWDGGIEIGIVLAVGGFEEILEYLSEIWAFLVERLPPSLAGLYTERAFEGVVDIESGGFVEYFDSFDFESIIGFFILNLELPEEDFWIWEFLLLFSLYHRN